MKRNNLNFQLLLTILVGILLTFTLSCKENKEVKTENIVKPKFTKHGELTFNSPEGKFLMKIDIEIADDDSKREQGLMYRDKMEEGQGMLFIFPQEEQRSFWMLNTMLSLDIIFVNSKNEIVKIHRNTTPYAKTSYPSNEPAQYVVEVIAGFTEKYNINEKDRIVWRRM